MIVRTWHGCVPVKYANAFSKHLQQTGVEHSHNTEGNLGAFVKQVTQNEWEHFFLATYWSDLEAIKRFAGENYLVAVKYAEDEKYELISDPYVFQHEVEKLEPLD